MANKRAECQIDNLWERLEDFLRQNAPKIYEGLAPGATENEIAEVEQTLGVRFPADVRLSYLRHNGQVLEGQTFVPCYFSLLPMPHISDTWEANIDVLEKLKDDLRDGRGASPGVKGVFLDRAWIPFASDMGGNQICLDFDPVPGGSIGQIVEFDHEASGQRCLAPSFRIWLDTISSDLESGRLIWNEELEGYSYLEDTDQMRGL